jgi:hypothetical protein
MRTRDGALREVALNSCRSVGRQGAPCTEAIMTVRTREEGIIPGLLVIIPAVCLLGICLTLVGLSAMTTGPTTASGEAPDPVHESHDAAPWALEDADLEEGRLRLGPVYMR